MNKAANSKTPLIDSTFEMFRISKAKAVVDLAPNTLRAYVRDGLPTYRKGRTVWFSKTEVAAFLRGRFASKQTTL